jgi:low temperature requirement protein LtrA
LHVKAAVVFIRRIEVRRGVRMNEETARARRAWWQKPYLHTEEEEQQHREVTWLELFYDLVFVAVIAQIAHYLSGHMTLQGAAGYVLLFLPVWWVWMAGTYYNERFETHGLENRVFAFLQMLPVAAMAVFAHDALGETGAQYALAYAAARLIHVFLWARAGYHVPVARPLTNRFVIGFSISILLFIASAFVEPPVRYWLWIAGLTLDLLTPVVSQKYQRALPRMSTSKLPERFGLLVIIVLGEVVVGTINGLAANHHLTWAVGAAALFGMALAFALWWVYFDFVARRPAKPSVWWTMSWGYLHLPLVMGMAAVGAGGLVLVGELGSIDAAKRLIAVAVGLTLVMTGALETTLRRDDDEPTHHVLSPAMKLVAGTVAASLAVVAESFTVLGLLLLLLALVFTQMVYGAYVWFTQDLPIDDIIE